ncbi:hypothetical protein NT239_13670 [Chitinibacter sp. SCUT-21]|uniref:TPR end-of-group domain-containing protein n=1 Tax=Chitinibacter sp. SCUT-21 TaxID=2970891 RepID=UPI0035A6C127
MRHLIASIIIYLSIFTPCAFAKKADIEPFTAKQQLEIEKIKNDLSNKLQDQNAQIIALQQARQFDLEQQKNWFETSRKSIDWWESHLSLFTGVVGFVIAGAGLAIPYLMGRNRRQELESDLKVIAQKLDEASKQLELAKEHTSALDNLVKDGHQKVAAIPTKEMSEEQQREILEELKNERPPQVAHLIQEAWDLYKAKKWHDALPHWRALRFIEGDDPSVWFNLGHCLQNTKSPSKEICEAYQNAAFLKKSAASYHNWGLALSTWAEESNGEEQQKLYSEAIEKYTLADSLRANDIQTLSCWADALASLAKNLEDKAQQKQLYDEALEKLKNASALDPNDLAISDSLGNFFMGWSHVLTGAERTQKLSTAKEHLLAAGHEGYYNLACWNAIQGEIEEAMKYLKLSEDAGNLPDRDHLEKDPDLINLQDLGWFKELLMRTSLSEKTAA